MGRNSTSTIPRPPGARDGSGGTPRSPRSDDTRLFQRQSNRRAFGIGVALIMLAIIAALFVLPLRAWQRQRSDLAAAKRELAAYEQAISELDAENARLVTAEGVRESARQDYGFKDSKEQVIGVLPPGPASDVMPPGWPYSLVRDIIAVRRDAIATAAADAARTTAPPPSTVPDAVDPTAAQAATTAASMPPNASDAAAVDATAAGAPTTAG